MKGRQEDSKVSINLGQVLGFLIEMWPLIFQLFPGTAYVGFKLCELKNQGSEMFYFFFKVSFDLGKETESPW